MLEGRRPGTSLGSAVPASRGVAPGGPRKQRNARKGRCRRIFTPPGGRERVTSLGDSQSTRGGEDGATLAGPGGQSRVNWQQGPNPALGTPCTSCSEGEKEEVKLSASQPGAPPTLPEKSSPSPSSSRSKLFPWAFAVAQLQRGRELYLAPSNYHFCHYYHLAFTVVFSFLFIRQPHVYRRY